MSDQASRDDWRRCWDGRPSGGTNGSGAGTGGRVFTALTQAYVAVAIVTFLICGVNVLSNLDEATRDGQVLMAWVPICKELSSWISILFACSLAILALRLATPGRTGWLRLALTHAMGSVAFSGVHQSAMTWLRFVIFAEYGRRYHRPPLPADLLYEYRKDLLTYLIVSGLFWLFQVLGSRAPLRSVEHHAEKTPSTPIEATFDIVDGAKTQRVPVGQILAVRAVRNYVEFLIEDGRTLLMRASLAAVEAALDPYGLMRTHRSWLINPVRLRSLEATGSGDYKLTLDGNIQVPLSRRYPATLDLLRRGRLDYDTSVYPTGQLGARDPIHGK